MLVARYSIPEVRSAARIYGRGKKFRYLYRCRTDRRGGELIVHEGCAENDIAPLTRSRGEGRKISGSHGCGWNEGRRALRARPRDGALVADEEKQFVLFNRTAKGSAKLIAFQRVPDRSKEISRVEFVIPHKLKRRAMKIVGTGFSDGVHRAAGVESILSRQRTRFDFEFLQSVRERQWQTVIGVDIVMHTAVERVCVSAE